MKIAIPTSDGQLAQHFGHCEQVTFIDVNEGQRTIQNVMQVTAPPHEHGVLPRLIRDHAATVVIAGGIGAGARALLERADIRVVAGAASLPPERIVQSYLDGTLVTGSNSCDHKSGFSHEHCH